MAINSIGFRYHCIGKRNKPPCFVDMIPWEDSYTNVLSKFLLRIDLEYFQKLMYRGMFCSKYLDSMNQLLKLLLTADQVRKICALLRIITHINLIRILYSACPLKENTQLDLSAQIYAKLIADKCLIGSNFKQYGVIKVALPITHLTEIVSHLYKEHIFYSFRLSYGGILTDRFTQLVWRSSTSIGIGIIRKRNLVYLALLFYPKGNIRGQYEINVLKKKISWKKMIQI
uniref:SCP domain-containing protein n=1 Tax=Strongyloides venezuelensis TaxID=75913 RepID=A0A0K0FW81_STRVS